MEPNKVLFSVIKTDFEKIKIIMKNVLTMLSKRIYIDKAGEKQPLLIFENAMKQMEDRGDNTFVVKANNKEIYAIKIVFQRITSIGKQSIVSDFLKDYAQHKKIIIAKDFNNKIMEHMNKQHTQIFRESSLLHDILEYRDQPKFEILSPTEIELFKSEYNATDYTTKKLLRSDPIAKYFALKKGDIVRIIRASPLSGNAIDYRVVL